MEDDEIEQLEQILENNRNCGAIEHNDNYDPDDFGDRDEDEN